MHDRASVCLVCVCVLAYVSVYGCVGVYVRVQCVYICMCVRVYYASVLHVYHAGVARGHLMKGDAGGRKLRCVVPLATCRLPALHLMRRLLAVVPLENWILRAPAARA